MPASQTGTQKASPEMPAASALDITRAAEAVAFTDDELNTALEAAAFYRDAKLAERSKLKLPSVVLYKGDPLPDADTLDGQILRAGSLVTKLTMEFMKRDLAAGETENVSSNPAA